MSKSSHSKMLKFRNLLWKLHYRLEKNEQHTSFEKLTDDPHYRAVILDSARKSNDDADLVKLAEKIIEQEHILDIHYVIKEGDSSHSITEASGSVVLQQKDDTWLKVASLMLLLVFISISVYSCSPSKTTTTNNLVPEKVKLSSAPTAPKSIPLAQNSKPVAEETTSVAKVATDKPEQDVTTKIQEKPVPFIPPKNTIMRLHGSNTIGEKLAPTLIKAYLTRLGATDIRTTLTADLEKSIAAHFPKAGWIDIELHAHGSTTSFEGLEQGLADMGMASRKIKDKEVTVLKKRYGDLTRPVSEHILGLDGLAIIVNKANPIDHLNTEQLAQLFSGEISSWSELGGDDIPVAIYAREANSGTWDTFKNLVLKKYKKKLSPTASRHESSSELSDLVADNVGAIGFIGLPYVRQSKLLAVADDANTQAIIPTLFTVGTEDYPLSRRLYFYTPEKQSKFMRKFIEFTQSTAGQNIVKQIGFISQNIYTVKPAIPTDSPVAYHELVKDSERLSLNLRFQSGSNLLDNKALRDMERLTRYISKNPGKQLSLFGFSDSIGEANYNLLLAKKRAQTIEVELQRRGIYANIVKGFGEQMPIASNTTKAGRNKNRRVEIWIKG